MDNLSLFERVSNVLLPVAPPHSQILVGLSGGVDSVVLLHLLHQLAPRFSWQLSALHVHHGISPNADAWAKFCAEFCTRLSIPLHLEKVDVQPLRHLGIEAAARQLRHAALQQHASDFIALAHHQDDQVETMLLQLLRGAGVNGAAAMPVVKVRRNQATLLRPLLGVSKAALLDYAQAQQVAWVDDESNLDVSYARNFLRQRVLPEVARHFPAYRQTLARSAQHFAESAQLQDELAALDGADFIHGNRLKMSALLGLSEVRGRNLLRYFLTQQGAQLPDSRRLQEMLRQVLHARDNATLCVAWHTHQVRRYQGEVYFLHHTPSRDGFCVAWQGEHILALQEGGELHCSQQAGLGISLLALQNKTVTVRTRQGGETLQMAKNRPRRRLKQLLQEHLIPPWLRDTYPLIYADEQLICVPNIGIELSYQVTEPELMGWSWRLARL
jgi:tRNA(Ile)-lysidine synthase